MSVDVQTQETEILKHSGHEVCWLQQWIAHTWRSKWIELVSFGGVTTATFFLVEPRQKDPAIGGQNNSGSNWGNSRTPRARLGSREFTRAGISTRKACSSGEPVRIDARY
jgi:hypothetical protein